jgi:chromosome segregation ATPase
MLSNGRKRARNRKSSASDLLGQPFVTRAKNNSIQRKLTSLNLIRKVEQQAQADLRSSCEDREIIARVEAVNEELTEWTNEQGKIQADIKQMKIWMDGDRHESKITAFAGEAMRFTERADDYEAKIASLQEKLPALTARIEELSRQLNQIELELLKP